MKLEITFGAGSGDEGTRGSDEPIRIAILGNFSASKASAGEAFLAGRVDIDNLDALLSKWRPVVRFAGPGGRGQPDEIEFSALEDFHPDRLLARPAFDDLWRLRQALDDPASREAAARRVADLTGGREVAEAAATDTESVEETMTRLLGEPEAKPGGVSGSPEGAVDRLVRGAVGGSAVPEKAASLEALELAADACIADRLRTLMANPVFRSLEGCWRGLHWLITRLEPEDRFETWVIDADRTGLADDLTGCGPAFEESRLFRTLEGIAGERPVSDFLDLIVVLDTVGGSVDDVGYLARFVDFADHCGVACVAEAHPTLVGASSVEALAEPRDWQRSEALTRAWEALRSRSAASRLGLVVPGFLLRLPYGPDADPIDRLEFEEVPGAPEHDRFLWGNGALAFTLLYCRGSVGAQGTVVEDLPAYVYPSEDGRRLMPCNGVLLGERAAQAIGALGIMPLVWPRSSNMLQLATRQSIGHA